MKGEIPARFEDPAAERKHKIKVGVVPECRGSHPDATSRSCAAAPDPAAAVQIDLVATRRIDPHRLIAIRRKEQMAMVGGQRRNVRRRPRQACGSLAPDYR